MWRTRTVLGFATTKPPTLRLLLNSTPRSEPDTSKKLRKDLVGE